jgi:hypothetical protein
MVDSKTEMQWIPFGFGFGAADIFKAEIKTKHGKIGAPNNVFALDLSKDPNFTSLPQIEDFLKR